MGGAPLRVFLALSSLQLVAACGSESASSPTDGAGQGATAGASGRSTNGGTSNGGTGATAAEGGTQSGGGSSEGGSGFGGTGGAGAAGGAPDGGEGAGPGSGGSGGADPSGGATSSGGSGATSSGGASVGGSAGAGGAGGDGGSSGNGGSGGASSSGPLSMGYILELEVGGQAALDQLDYSAVDYVIHAFVDVNANTAAMSGVGSFDAYRNAGIANKVHGAGSKIVMSLGGANHSWGLKQVAKNPSLIATLADNIVSNINAWGYDGVDIDLEFPWGGSEPEEHLNLLTVVYQKVKSNDPEHLVLFGVSPGYLLTEFRFAELRQVSDYAFYFCYDWKNPANGPMRNPGVNFTAFGGAQFEASCRGALNYMVDQGYPADQIVVGLPFYANGGARFHTASSSIKNGTPHPDWLEVHDGSGGYWPNATGTAMKIEAVLDPSQTVFNNGATAAGVGFWEWGYEDPADPQLSQTIKAKTQ